MAEPVLITDPADARLGDYLGLRDPQGRRVSEERAGFFVAEGITVLERVIDSTLAIRSVLLLPKRWDRLAPMLERIDAPVYLAERDVLEAITGFDLHRGVVAAVQRPAEPSLAEALSRADLVLVAEGLNDPENLGAIARSARAFGADALLLDPTCADPFARRTVRVSMGELIGLPVVRLREWPNELGDIAAAGFTVVALTPALDATPLDEITARKVALVLGAEGPGLTAAAQRGATVRARIPIDPGVDSLNVGHAAAVALATFSPFGR